MMKYSPQLTSHYLREKISLLLLLLCLVPKFHSQILYYTEDVSITIDKNTTLYIADSGNIGHEKIKKNVIRKSKQNKKGLLAEKKDKSNSQKNLKEVLTDKSKANKYPAPKTIHFVQSSSDRFFSAGQKTIALSCSINPVYSLKLWIEPQKIKFIKNDWSHKDIKPESNGLYFLKDYNLLQFITRPPPYHIYSSIIKNKCMLI